MELEARKNEVIKLAEFNLDVIRLMLGSDQLRLSTKAQEKIIQHQWNDINNELEVVLEKAAQKCRSGLIEPEDIDLQITEGSNFNLPAGLKLEELERKYILQTLFIAGQNRTKAAEMLGISIRTLRNKISQYRLEGFL